MENANNKKGSFMGLLPLVIFLVVYFLGIRYFIIYEEPGS